MIRQTPKLGLLIPNRATIIGDLTAADLIDLAVRADQSEFFDSVWVGDSILAKPRLEAIALLSAIAARTSKVMLGPACFASFPLRNPIQLAYEWSSLDSISNGRTIMAACLGGGSRHYGGDFSSEFDVFGLAEASRISLFEENLEIVRRLWEETEVTHHGEHYSFKNVTVEPRPIQEPRPPLWIASNPHIFGWSEKRNASALTRVARMADGWMSAVCPPDLLVRLLERLDQACDEVGRNRDELATCVLMAANVNDDPDAAVRESTEFLNQYYMTSYSDEEIQGWGAFGPPDVIANRISAYYEAGVDTVIVRPTSWSQIPQFNAICADVLPQVRHPS